MSQIASCADWEAQIDARSIHGASEDFGFAERGIFRSRRATASERCLGWYWTDWNQVLRQDASDLRPHRQDPGFASSQASWYHTLEKAGLSTFWCFPTSSKEVWSMLHQTALEYLMKPPSNRFSLFWGQGPDLVSNIEIMMESNFFHLQSMSKA